MALASPAEKYGFYYAGDSLYCEASNRNRHRRATIPELKAHFKGADDHPAHWYEAQLLHYGLAPSKVKGTAHKRLMDAVRKGGLTVPPHIQKIEADLKKEWTKRERDAKKVSKGSAAGTSSAKGTKRKADQVSANVNVNVSVQVSSTGSVSVRAAQPAAKKTKTTPKTATAKSPAKTKSTPKAATVKGSAKPKNVTTPTTTRPIPSTSNATGASGSSFSAGYDDVPPPYSEYDPGHASSRQVHQQPSSQRSPQPRLGLLNGRYRLDCAYIEDMWPAYEGDLGLVATLDGNTLWLSFDFGAASGMMKVPRPYEPDAEDGTTVFWRGHTCDDQGYRNFRAIDSVYRAGPCNKLYFLGDGHIHGLIRYGPGYDQVQIDFDAYRLPGQSMTSEVSPTEARAKWADLGQLDDRQ